MATNALVRTVLRRIVVAPGLLAAISAAPMPQQPMEVSADVAAQHLVKRVEPAFPPLAKMARLQGTVHLTLHIGKDGTVLDTKVKSGHPLFIQSAVDAVKQWRYSPFVSDGKPVEAIVPADVLFSLGIPDKEYKKEMETSGQYFEKWNKCHDLVSSKQYDQAEPLCRAAVDLAEQHPPSRAGERTGAYADLGWAIMGEKKFPEALPYFRKEVALGEKVRKPDDSDLGYAYHNLALGLLLNGDLDGSLKYFRRSIDTLELAREHARTDGILAGLKEEYTKSLRTELKEYATLLRRSGDSAAAEAAEERANSLQ